MNCFYFAAEKWVSVRGSLIWKNKSVPCDRVGEITRLPVTLENAACLLNSPACGVSDIWNAGNLWFAPHCHVYGVVAIRADNINLTTKWHFHDRIKPTYQFLRSAMITSFYRWICCLWLFCLNVHRICPVLGAFSDYHIWAAAWPNGSLGVGNCLGTYALGLPRKAIRTHSVGIHEQSSAAVQNPVTLGLWILWSWRPSAV